MTTACLSADRSPAGGVLHIMCQCLVGSVFREQCLLAVVRLQSALPLPTATPPCPPCLRERLSTGLEDEDQAALNPGDGYSSAAGSSAAGAGAGVSFFLAGGISHFSPIGTMKKVLAPSIRLPVVLPATSPWPMIGAPSSS